MLVIVFSYVDFVLSVKRWFFRILQIERNINRQLILANIAGLPICFAYPKYKLIEISDEFDN